MATPAGQLARMPARLRASALLGRRRRLHTALPVSSLPFDVDRGIAPFLSANTTRMLAVDWQQGLLDRLNEHVAGTDSEGKTLFDTIIDLAKDRTKTVPFNLASEALNNSFFLNGLRPVKPTRSSWRGPSKDSPLAREIEQTYGSVTQLISYFSSAAMGMFSSGYVWLTCDQSGLLGVCATYGGGTVLVQNRQQRGDWGTLLVPPMPTPTPEVPPPPPSADSLTAGVRRFSTSAASRFAGDDGKGHGASFADALFDSAPPIRQSTYGASTSTIGRPSRRQAYSSLYPLLGLQVAERAWIGDYGVWGKEAYVRNFWECVDWAKAEAEFGRRQTSLR